MEQLQDARQLTSNTIVDVATELSSEQDDNAAGAAVASSRNENNSNRLSSSEMLWRSRTLECTQTPSTAVSDQVCRLCFFKVSID